MSLEESRISLHTLAETVAAGPQYATSGTIRLRVVQRAVTTVADPVVRIDATGVSGPGGSVALADVTTAAAVGEAIGVTAGRAGIYPDSSGRQPDDRLTLDAGDVERLLTWYAVGSLALAAFAAQETTVLWPEHFDLAISVDGINYGVSGGDRYSAEPYAYVGPPEVPPDDPFFDVAFGALRTWDQVPDAAAVTAFFSEGRSRLSERG